MGVAEMLIKDEGLLGLEIDETKLQKNFCTLKMSNMVIKLIVSGGMWLRQSEGSLVEVPVSTSTTTR